MVASAPGGLFFCARSFLFFRFLRVFIVSARLWQGERQWRGRKWRGGAGGAWVQRDADRQRRAENRGLVGKPARGGRAAARGGVLSGVDGQHVALLPQVLIFVVGLYWTKVYSRR